MRELQIYLINTRTHCRTPATPVQTDGPLSVSASCTNKPTDPARQTKETTYATKSQSFTLQIKKPMLEYYAHAIEPMRKINKDCVPALMNLGRRNFS
jgi:hypothetical protein